MPNFYFNYTYTDHLTVEHDLNVKGATTLASLSAAATTIGGTLGVTGQTTLAALTAAATTIGGTLGVTGQTTLAALTAAATTIGSTLGVTGQTTLAGASVTSLVAHGNIDVDTNSGVKFLGSSGDFVRLVQGPSSLFYFETFDGTAYYYPIQFTNMTGIPNTKLIAHVTGNQIGNAALKHSHDALTHVIVGPFASYTPTAGLYLMVTDDAVWGYTIGSNTSTSGILAGTFSFDGADFVNNYSSSLSTVYFTRMTS